MNDEKVDSFEKFFYTINELLLKCGTRDALLENFSKLQSDEERVAFLYGVQEIQDYDLEADFFWNAKSADDSTNLRNEGNGFFQKKKNMAALRKYNASVASAPLDGDKKELGLAIANRSAVLFHMKKFKQCMNDIGEAFKCAYPEELRYKLHDRKGKCLVKLGQFDDAKVSFEAAKAFLSNAKLDEKKRGSWLTDLVKQMECCEIDGNDTCKKAPPKGVEELKKYKIPSLSSEAINAKFPFLSSDVFVNVTGERGRFPCATREIKIGEVIAIDKPYASVVVPSQVATHCYQCFQHLLVSVPCNQCAFVSYCSEQCRNVSWEKHHSVECSFLPAINNSEVGLGRLSVRAIVLTGLKNLRNFNGDTPVPQGGIAGCNKDGVYRNDYNSIYHLVNHSEKREVADLSRMTAIAVFLTKCLQKANFFSNNGTCGDEDFVLVSSHILRNIQMMPCNAHEVSELELDTRAIATSSKVEIGSAIYATLSLFNHSCDPNVIRHSYGDVCVVRAVRQIRKGEEIVDNYGYLCAVTPKQRRQYRLQRQYFFNCSCVACEEDWPQYLEMEDSMPVFKCTKCLGAVCLSNENNPNTILCVNCHTPQDISGKLEVWNKSHFKYSQVMEGIQSSAPLNLKAWIKPVLSHLCFLDDFACRPNKEFNEGQEALKQCWSIKANCRLINQ